MGPLDSQADMPSSRTERTTSAPPPLPNCSRVGRSSSEHLLEAEDRDPSSDEEELNVNLPETGLRECLRAAESVLDSVPVGVVVADDAGRFRYFNQTAVKVLGNTAIDVVPEKWASTYGAFLPDAVTPFPAEELPLVLALGGKQSNGVEMVIRKTDSSHVAHIAVNARPLIDAAGCIKGAVVVFEDLDALDMSCVYSPVDAEELADVWTTDILTEYQHFLRTLTGCTEMALNDFSECRNSNLEDAIRATDWTQILLEGVLACMHQCISDRELVPLSILVDEVFYFLRDSISSSIELRQNLADIDARVLIDPPEIHQALMNVFTNACTAMGNNGGVLVVDARIIEHEALPVNGFKGSSSGAYVKLTVRDTGPGIDDMAIEHVFEPFVANEAAEKGCGLGLFVTRKIITEHGGYITAQSEPNKGTSFHIYLPVVAG